MTKLQLLHQALNERLMTTVEQIMALVSETVLEYEAETVRVRMENEALRRKLVAFECPETPVELPGPSDAVSLSLPEHFSIECLAEELWFKQEPACDFLCSESTTNLITTPNIPASVAEMNRDVTMNLTQSYMAPVEFDPTEPQQNLSRKQKFSFTCLVCSKVFARKTTLDIHKRVHSKPSPYELRHHKTDQKKKWKQHIFSQMQRAELSNTMSDEHDQNSNETLTPLSEEFTAEQITSHTCPEDHLTQNLCEKATNTTKMEDNFIKVPKKAAVDKDVILKVLCASKEAILKNDNIAIPSNCIWRELSRSLESKISAKALYTFVKLNRHNVWSVLGYSAPVTRETVIPEQVPFLLLSAMTPNTLDQTLHYSMDH